MEDLGGKRMLLTLCNDRSFDAYSSASSPLLASFLELQALDAAHHHQHHRI